MATICSQLKDSDGALIHYLACVPLVDAKTGDFQKTELFRTVLALLETRKEALRLLYLLSWSKAVLGGPLSIDEQLQVT